MKYILILIVAFLTITAQSCKDENEEIVASPFTVKYEIISTNQNITRSYMSYIDEGQQITTVNALSFTNTWSKSFNVLLANRPLDFSLSVDAPLYTNSKGTIQVNIYINDKLKATVTKATENSTSNYFYLPFTLKYTVK